MKFCLIGLLAGVWLGFGSDAASLYAKGRAAEKAGHFDQAYVLYSEAAALDPGNRTYWFRSQAVRSRAALQAKPLPYGTPGSLSPDPTEKQFPSITARDLADSRTMQPPPELSADPKPRDLDFRADSRSLFQNVAQAFGLDCVFDGDYQAGMPIHFQVRDMDYRQALRALDAATGSFIVPLTPKLFLVAKDTQQKRNEVEPFVSVAVEIPQATTPQEVQEVARAVQQSLALDKLALDSQRDIVVFRGPASKVAPARRLFEDLIRHRAQVSVEMEFLEVSRQDMLTYGLNLPNTFSLVNFNSAAKVATQLSSLARGGFGGMAFGLAIGNAQLFAQMSHSLGKTLYRTEMKSVDGQAASLHIGERYPVLTTGYFGSTNAAISSSTNAGTSTGTSAAQASVTFGSVPNPSAIVSADFNQDGIPDLAAAAAGGNEAAVLLGNGDGTFQTAVTYATGTNPSAIAAADFNGDGFIDLVTADSGSNTISILLGKGDGTFEAATQVPAGTTPAALVVADFNADGTADIAVANSGSNNVFILLGRGDGTFQAPITLAAGTSPRSLVAEDLNADGIIDLACANFSSNDLSIFLGNGNGTFTQSATYTTGNSPRAVIANTLTTSGHVDLVVANSASNTVSVFLGTGTGAFAEGVQFATGSGPVSLASGDFNSDGLQDLAAVNYGDGTLSLLVGLGTGSFETPISLTVGSGPDSVISGDFNRDGLKDLLVANSTTNNFSILLGAGTGTFHDPGGNYFPTSGGQVYAPPPAFTYQDLGLSVKVTPHVHGEDEVSLDLDAEIQLLTGAAVNGVPVIAHRKLVSQVQLRNGEWAIVAGLLTTSEARSIAGIAGLSSLPGIGPLMRQNTKNTATDEVLVLLKTNLINIPPGQFVSHTIPVGSETRPLPPL
ncbi:MAG: VCBS repeat-containing protein [Acidobacteriia bacterium]|nr:VCBS repeat-containing protein [Terriglobia bacterium]